jgi:hypothetical protein
VHVDENGTISPALQEVFLPHRKAVLEAFINGTTRRTMAVHGVSPDVAAELTIGGPRRTH